MQPTNNITGRTAVLQLVSAFTDHPSTFVLRETRELQRLGLPITIVQLRPVLGPMNLAGFEDLSSMVVRPRWLSLDALAGFAHYGVKQPQSLGRFISFVLNHGGTARNKAKMFYVLLVSVMMAYRFRSWRIGHLRAHFLHTEALAAYFMSGFLQIPYSLTAHTVAAPYPSFVVGELAQRAAFVVSDTKQVKRFLHSLGVSGKSVRVIRNGVPIEELPFRENQSAPDPPVILAAGYLVPKKGFHVLLAACALLRQRGIRFRCVIVGDGVERQRLLKQKKTNLLEKEVEMLGNLSFAELRGWYYQSTLFVMPSMILGDGSTDGLPTVVIEALACGTPVIGTNIAAIPEVIVDGVTGFLVEADSPGPLADRIQLILSQEPLRRSFAREGRHLIEREFNLGRNSQILANLILSHMAPATPLLAFAPQVHDQEMLPQ
jgi:colanic acid/amylovoran biosynthesis glycosyltransferase